MEANSQRAPIRVLLVDDSESFRTVTRALLTTEDFEVVGEAGNGENVLELAKVTRPDVALVDCRMPNVDGPETTRRLSGMRPEIGVIALSVGDDADGLEQMRRAGAVDVLLKGAGPTEIGQAIRSAAKR